MIYVVESLTADERNQINILDFGIPSEKKYPLDTKEHVLSAIKLFNHVDAKNEKKLANKIKNAIEEFDISEDEIHITKNNRFYKYLYKDKER